MTQGSLANSNIWVGPASLIDRMQMNNPVWAEHGLLLVERARAPGRRREHRPRARSFDPASDGHQATSPPRVVPPHRG